ncbi:MULTISPECIES: type VII secretion protein EsaA [Bacillaceae]|uniref:Type VII secretion system accessory factor EsaA n=1 Tax=Evansella alkalicola TaxID=745819 RepID=A0ABS6K1Z7_9BACI|nr:MULTISPECIES: type VII secretion protein EsaA [Bacillaceae]MBU9723480.1 type VII secretion protein EsaA [Bacillus alkalicola]
MKKKKSPIILLFVLILLLISGLSYFALNPVSKTATVDGTQLMTVALVNEDEGATFNNNFLSFGNAFVRSLDNNDEHEWFVVSRGVAESGLERQVYDMMIVIPNDFTRKALSIESESPERVTLDYKINASGNDEVRPQAEKTASQILNDFNRRIIDVYFASVIGNLQEAQDSIASIVDNYGLYVDTYNTDVNTPLANYTNQFESVKGYTELSKTNFDQLDNRIHSFQDYLVENASSYHDFLSNLNEVSDKKEETSTLSTEYFNSLSEFDAALREQNIQEQLNNLQQANNHINSQFQLNENMMSGSIVADTINLQSFINRANELVRQTEENLIGTLESDLKSKVRRQLSSILAESFNKEFVNLNSLLDSPDKNVHDAIQRQINQLPSLSEKDIDESGLSEETTTELKNVIAVTNKYMNEFNFKPGEQDDSKLLSRQIRDIKQRFADTGVMMSDSVQLPKNRKPGQTFELTIPDVYEIQGLWITLPNGEEEEYTNIYLEKGKLNLPANDEGVFTVRINLRLLDADSNIDVFQPATWSWKMKQKNIDDIDNPDQISDPVDNEPAPENGEPEQEEGSSNEEVAEEESEMDSEEKANSNDDRRPQSEESSQTDEEGRTEEEGSNEEEESNEEEGNDEEGNIDEDEDSNENGESDGDSSDEENGDSNDDEENEKPEIIRVKVVNNYIYHRVMSPLLDEPTQLLINAADSTVRDYQKMILLYEIYFGIDMRDEELREWLGDKSLTDLSTESSLYYLFNHKELDELLTNYFVKRVTDGVAKEIRRPLEDFREQVTAYRQHIDATEDKMDQLAEKVGSTMEQALVMNTALTEVLENVEDWRRESMRLLEEQQQLQAVGSEEQTAVMTLESNFQPLLSTSELLAEQASDNRNEAENVYQTFEMIDNQANAIQESGVGLVSQAERLGEDLTNQILEDEVFVENFAGVLSNSRIGERQNEDLFDFLSNPVETNNQGTIVSGDTFTPYFLVLIIFIVALFTGYVIAANYHKENEKDTFESKQSLVSRNTPITVLTLVTGLVEGLLIGIISSYFLGLTGANMISYIFLTTFITLMILLAATYLLRQLKTVGMFVLLVVLSMYLFSSRAIGTNNLGAGALRDISPLEYIERWITSSIDSSANYLTMILIIIGISIVLLVANLIVFNLGSRNGELDDDSKAKAS